jgi:hypothetical protein
MLLNLLTYPRLKARQLLGEFSKAISKVLIEANVKSYLWSITRP